MEEVVNNSDCTFEMNDGEVHCIVMEIGHKYSNVEEGSWDRGCEKDHQSGCIVLINARGM